MPRKSASGSDGVLQSFAVSIPNVANQFQSREFTLPLLNLPNKSPTQYLAIEVHKVEVFKPQPETHNIVWGLTSNNLNTASTASNAVNLMCIDPRTIVSGAIAQEAYALFDLTDDSDRGILYPNQKLYITTTAHTNTDTVIVRFWYKVVHVSQEAYLSMMNNYFLLA
jgi:hypothetical protein